MLIKNPQKRIGLDEALNHSFFKNLDIEDDQEDLEDAKQEESNTMEKNMNMAKLNQ